MGNTEITLNGKDWSNLYIADYAGGAGGEMFCELLASKIAPKVFWNKSNRNTVVDSVYNMFATDGLPDFITKLCDTDNDFKILLKTAIVFSEIVNETSSNWNGNLKYSMIGHLINNIIDMIDDYSVLQDKILNTTVDNNVIIRTHDSSQDYESLPNAKVFRIYPKTKEAHNLIFFRIGIVKWLEVSNGVMQWEIENKDKNINADTFEEFVELNFCEWPGDIYKNTIDALDWLTVGINEIDDTDELIQWREKNKNFFISYDIDINNPPPLEVLKHKLYKQYRRHVYS